MEHTLDKRYQTLLVLWFALLMSVGMYFLFSVVAAPEIIQGPGTSSRSTLIFALTAIGTFLVIVSFPVKQKFLRRSIENQDVSLVQKGLVFSCALCEVSALLGLVERFVVGNREYYLLFLVAAAGIIAHFPRRSQLEAAGYKSPGQF